jgi:hypothetical protein
VITFRLVVSFWPSWPPALSPRHHSVPVLFRAQVWCAPAATTDQSVSVPTCVGFVFRSHPLSPFWPNSPSPQQYSAWELFTPQPCAVPDASDIQVFDPKMVSGVLPAVVTAEPLPNWELRLPPQHEPAPAVAPALGRAAAQVWVVPADTSSQLPATCTGEVWSVVFPLPTCPTLFNPQQ